MFWLIILALCSSVHARCYTPDGSLSSDVPCDANAKVSVCCQVGWLCLSNGLCISEPAWQNTTNNLYIRGTCTDSSFKSPTCGEQCINENPSGGEFVFQCAANSWCCSDDGCCNDDDAPKLALGVPSPTATAEPQSKTSSTATSASSKTSASSSNTGSTSKHSPSSTSSKGHSSKLGIGLGVGLGVGLGIIALIAVGWFVFRKRQKRTFDKNESYTNSPPAYENMYAPQKVAADTTLAEMATGQEERASIPFELPAHTRG